MFKRSEQNVLKLILKICRETVGVPAEVSALRLKDVDMMFTRRNYENIQSKAQVLDLMLKNPKIHPRLAFAHCGMFSDAEEAYSASEEYHMSNSTANKEDNDDGDLETD